MTMHASKQTRKVKQLIISRYIIDNQISPDQDIDMESVVEWIARTFLKETFISAAQSQRQERPDSILDSWRNWRSQQQFKILKSFRTESNLQTNVTLSLSKGPKCPQS